MKKEGIEMFGDTLVLLKLHFVPFVLQSIFLSRKKNVSEDARSTVAIIKDSRGEV